MKTRLLLMSFLFALNGMTQNDAQIVNASGLFLTNSLFAFDISIGEPLIATINGGSNLISQGFLQPEITKGTNVNTFNTDFHIRFYPNPFNNKIEIVSDMNDLHFQICDITGKTVFEQRENYLLDLAFLSNGIYTLLVFNENNIPVALEKICKTN